MRIIKIKQGQGISVRIDGRTERGRVVKVTRAPAGKQRFTVKFSDGSEREFRCSGFGITPTREKVGS